MLKIGVINQDKWSEALGAELQSILKEKIQVESAVKTYKNSLEIWHKIHSAEVSVMAAPLSSLPTSLPKGIVITALSGRQNASNSLIISKNSIDESQLLSLKTGVKIGFQNHVQNLQFQEFRSDLDFETHEISPFQAIEKLENKELDACVLATECLSFLDLDNEKYLIIPFSPKEYMPLAGQGVTAYITAEEDLTTRRLLKSVFKTSKLTTGQAVSMVTNVERKLKQLFNDTDIAVYCEIDRANNYHILAATIINGTLKKIRISQSTSFELAETCFNKLQ